MKELTAAQGLLRCGECDAVFDAMKTLSTTLPEERRFAQLSTATAADLPELVAPKQIWQTAAKSAKPLKPTKSSQLGVKPVNPRKSLFIGIAALTLLLLLQVLYSNRDWLVKQPATAALTRQVCGLLGCEITVPRDVRKINLLSRNIYSHPNTPKVLTISASIQNDAVFPQPYPLIEISFLDQKNAILALRRFPPEEYIKDFKGELMPVGVPDELLLNISDPGEAAVRFQFRFM
jgi:hypothetical protein